MAPSYSRKVVVWPDATDPLDGESANALAAEIRLRLGPAPEPPSSPPVSIVVLNRNGAGHLKRLLEGLTERTDYPDFELILVDNGSRDESLELVRSAQAPFPISILANHHNESFSDANNQGAELASGELVLFLNNDVVPFEAGWLRELVGCLQTTQAGIVGATLVFPKGNSAHGYLVQHRAMHLVDDAVFLSADLHGHGDEPFADGFGEDADSAIPTGACMLIERDLLRQVGGFTHGYVYGGEDIDLGLKVLTKGRRVICSGRSILIHRFGSTRKHEGPKARRAAISRNQRLLWERWGPRLRREFELDRLSGGGSWATPGQALAPDGPSRKEVLSLGFCLRSSEPAVATPAEDPLDTLSTELGRRGHRNVVLREDAIDDPVGSNYDIAVHLRGPARYVPKPAQFNVLWAIGHNDSLTGIECDRYDLVLTSNSGLAGRIRKEEPSTLLAILTEQEWPAQLIEEVLACATQLDFPTRITPSTDGCG